MQTYAIGDIHGHIDLLKAAHDRIERDRAASGADDAPIVHIGDLVDRGPHSRDVVEYLRQGIAAGKNWIVLKGNHDRMFAGFVRDQKHHDAGLRADLSWLHPRLGGGTTLGSYGVANASDRPVGHVHREALERVPEVHLQFIESLPTQYQRGEVVFVHAGIRPGVPLPDQAEDDLVWIREPFLSDTRNFGPLIVHGHTAIEHAVHYGNRVNIDSSAAYGGPLTAAVFDGREPFILTPNDRVALRPTPDAAVR